MRVQPLAPVLFSLLLTWVLAPGHALAHGPFSPQHHGPDPMALLQEAPSEGELSPAKGKMEIAAHERLITILQTNDIHGGVETGQDRAGIPLGGMAHWIGSIHAIQKGLARQFPKRAAVLVVDSGDQFQGTLVSNYNEGKLVFDLMNLAGYHAVVPGNHDYDFGPEGWLVDKVVPGHPDQNPLSVIEGLAARAKFPLLAANVYRKNTQVRPAFLKSHVIKRGIGVRVALVGLENMHTSKITTVENVEGLDFRDEVEEYLKLRKQLDGKADIFVALIHQGNTITELSATEFVKRVTERWKGSGRPVDAVMAAHTHFRNNTMVEGVPIIQSLSQGNYYGRVDLIWDTKAKRLMTERTRTFAGVPLYYDRCPPMIDSYCSVNLMQSTGEKFVTLEGEPVVPSARALSLIREARDQIDHLAARKIGYADGILGRQRIYDSPMANAMTDAFRDISGVEVAMMNTSGMRADFEEGTITYEDLFRVLPFNNHGVVMDSMNVDQLLALLTRSAQTCGAYGALMQSGLRVTFERDCENRASFSIDPQARVLSVRTVDGEVIYEDKKGQVAPVTRTFEVATLDFLASGGSGYTGFKGVPITADLGILREVLAEKLIQKPARFSSRTDGRWREIRPNSRR